MKKALEEGAADAGFADDVARFRYSDHGIEDWISVAILWVDVDIRLPAIFYPLLSQQFAGLDGRDFPAIC